MTFQQAIARQEGFGVPNAIPTTHHNPGNVIAGQWAAQHGAIPYPGFIAMFPNDQIGWAALTALLRGPFYFGLTVQEAIYKYLGMKPSTGSTDAHGDNATLYIHDVCQWCACTPDTPIAGLLG